MVISITEAGEVEAERRRVIANELTWPVVIKKVVEEGSVVQEGQTIILFECKELIDAIQQQQITVTNASNEYTQARENLELKRKELDNNVRKAEQAVRDAEEDLQRYLEGQWPIDKSDAESAITLARRDLALAQDQLEFKKKANEDPELKQPYSTNEIRADELAVDRLKMALEKAISARDMLVKYDHPRQVRKFEIAVSDAGLDLERARIEAKTQLMVAQAKAQAEKATFDMKQAKLDELLEDQRKLEVKADRAGLVIYDTGGSRWRPSNVQVAVGERISSRQQLMIIPDMTSLQVETKVYEAVIDQVRIGQKAFIRLDARPDVTLTGQVAKVGAVPNSQDRFWNPDVKVFDVTVKFDDPEAVKDLKPNMTAQVELELARLADVLSVPVAAVFTEQEQTYTWKVDGAQRRKLPVKVGRTNETRVVIRSGLSQGERVLLAPPTGAVAPSGPQQGEADGEQQQAPPAPAVGGQGGPGEGAPAAQAPSAPRRQRNARARPGGRRGGSRP